MRRKLSLTDLVCASARHARRCRGAGAEPGQSCTLSSPLTWTRALIRACFSSRRVRVLMPRASSSPSGKCLATRACEYRTIQTATRQMAIRPTFGESGAESAMRSIPRQGDCPVVRHVGLRARSTTERIHLRSGASTRLGEQTLLLELNNSVFD